MITSCIDPCLGIRTLCGSSIGYRGLSISVAWEMSIVFLKDASFYSTWMGMSAVSCFHTPLSVPCGTSLPVGNAQEYQKKVFENIRKEVLVVLANSPSCFTIVDSDDLLQMSLTSVFYHMKKWLQLRLGCKQSFRENRIREVFFYLFNFILLLVLISI